MIVRIIVIIFFSLSQIHGHGQNNEIRKFYQDGTIKQLQIFNSKKQLVEESQYNPYGKVYSKQIYLYLKGLVYEEDYYNSEEINFKIKNEYNRKKQVIKKLWYKANDSLNWYETYKYDKLGNKIKSITFEPNDSISYIETYVYNNYNNLIENYIFYPNGTESSRVSYKYDTLNRCIEERSFDDGKLNFIEKYEYDKFDNKIRELVYYQDEINLVSEILYKYNAKRLLYNKELYQDNKLIVRTLSNYDSNGNLIEETIENGRKVISRKKFNGDGLPISEYFYHKSLDFIELSNIYDRKGNLIEMNEYENNSLESSLINKYDSTGSHIESVKTWGNGSISTWKYNFDEKGRNIGWRQYGNCNQLYTVVEIQYDEESNNSISNSTNYINGLPVESYIMLIEKGKESSQCLEKKSYKDGLVYCRKKYNNEGKESEAFYYKDGVISTKYVYTYNNEIDSRVKYEYDNNGLLISKYILE